MTMHFRNLADQVTADGAIAPEELLALRQAAWSDGRIDPTEAEALFVVNDHLAEHSPEWSDFFWETLTEFVVNGGDLRGYVDPARGDWLIARINRDGRVESLTELELLVRVVERALNAPDALKQFVLAEIEQAVLTGTGPTRAGELDGEGINTAEVALLRRVIFAAGGDRPAAVSKAEAELLFRLKDACLYDNNAADWERLFVQGVGNYLLGFGGAEPLSAERAGELEAFMAAPGRGVGAFLAGMTTASPAQGFASLLDDSDEDAGEARDAAVAEAAQLTEGEELWLQDRLDADEDLDPLEKALLAFIAAETDAG